MGKKSHAKTTCPDIFNLAIWFNFDYTFNDKLFYRNAFTEKIFRVRVAGLYVNHYSLDCFQELFEKSFEQQCKKIRPLIGLLISPIVS